MDDFLKKAESAYNHGEPIEGNRKKISHRKYGQGAKMEDLPFIGQVAATYIEGEKIPPEIRRQIRRASKSKSRKR